MHFILPELAIFASGLRENSERSPNIPMGGRLRICHDHVSGLLRNLPNIPGFFEMGHARKSTRKMLAENAFSDIIAVIGNFPVWLAVGHQNPERL
jgi:hypothetical protein